MPISYGEEEDRRRQEYAKHLEDALQTYKYKLRTQGNLVSRKPEHPPKLISKVSSSKSLLQQKWEHGEVITDDKGHMLHIKKPNAEKVKLLHNLEFRGVDDQELKKYIKNQLKAKKGRIQIETQQAHQLGTLRLEGQEKVFKASPILREHFHQITPTSALDAEMDVMRQIR
jgi:hypothetical protein